MHIDIRNAIDITLPADDPRADNWGEAMSAWFDVADVLEHELRAGLIPADWQYRHSPVCEGTEAYERFGFAAQHATLDDFVHAGNVLARYTRMLDRLGYSY